MRFLGLFRGRGFAGPDCPDWFVGNHRFLELFTVQSGQAVAQLTAKNLFNSTCIALLKCFTDAGDYGQTGSQTCLNFLVNNLIRFEIVLTAFRMADDDVRAACIANHESRDFSGERAFALFSRAILG